MSRRRNRNKRGLVPKSPDPESHREQRQLLVRSEVTAASFSGPLPPPETLVKYNEPVPDGAERIIAMAEKQAEHRMKQEGRGIGADIVRANLGLGAGFIVALGGLGASYFLIDGGNAAAGVALGSVDLVGLVGAFIFGTISRSRERKERAEIMSRES